MGVSSNNSMNREVLLILPILVTVVFFQQPRTMDCRGLVGVVYRVDIPGVPNPSVVVPALVGAGIPRVRLVNANASDIATFVGADMDINLAIQNMDLIKAMASNFSFALRWVNESIAPTHPQAGISSISVGQGIFTNFPNLSHIVLPAVKNVYHACTNLSLHNISVSTCHSFRLVTQAFPPSSAEIIKSVQPHMKPLLEFLTETRAPFEINLFPFELYRSKAVPGVTNNFVMFEAWDDDYLVDPGTQCTYPNLYAVMVDAVIMALYKMSHSGMAITVAGTGWPSDGNKVKEPEASQLFAAEYNMRLVSLVNMRIGTPMRQNSDPIAYIYTLFDEPRKKGVESYQNNWGIWHTDLTVKYAINFGTSGVDIDNKSLKPLLQFCFLWVVSFLFLFLIEEDRLF